MEQQPRLPLWFLVANWALIGAAFVIGILLGKGHHPAWPEPQGQALELVYEEILKKHVEAQDGSVLLDRAIEAMVDKLDEYSHYVSPSELARYDEHSTGRYEGIGAVPAQFGDDVVVLFPFTNGPAERAGIRPGDRILAVDGTLTTSLPKDNRTTKLSELLRGPANSDVRVRLGRGDGDVELVVHRAEVQRPSVKWTHFVDAAQGLGYIHIADFHAEVAKEVIAAIADLRARGPLHGLVVDLRFDLGGSLDGCVELARAFQPTGTIVSTRRRDQVTETIEAKPELCKFPDLPLVLLVNERSASASEVLSGCLQDHGRAALVGVRTYGKGVVNTVSTWGNLPFKLKLTTAHYFTPNGRNIEGHSLAIKDGENGGAGQPQRRKTGGIEPDFVVPVTPDQNLAIEAQLAANELPPQHAAAFQTVVDKYGEKYGIAVPLPPQPAADPQLLKAMTVLQERIAAPSGKTQSPAAGNK